MEQLALQELQSGFCTPILNSLLLTLAPFKHVGSSKALPLVHEVQKMFRKSTLEVFFTWSLRFYSSLLFFVFFPCGESHGKVETGHQPFTYEQSCSDYEVEDVVSSIYLLSIRKDCFMAIAHPEGCILPYPHQELRNYLLFVLEWVFYQFKVIHFCLSNISQVFTSFQVNSLWTYVRCTHLLHYLCSWMVMTQSLFHLANFKISSCSCVTTLASWSTGRSRILNSSNGQSILACWSTQWRMGLSSRKVVAQFLSLFHPPTHFR